LYLKFAEESIIDVEDIIYIYCYGVDHSKGKPYGILFNSSSKHELTEEAVIYLADHSKSNNLAAIAYISQSLLSKIRLSLLLIFENPRIKPKVFREEAPAIVWLQQQIASYGQSPAVA
jgi:hypothetical protein